MSKDKLNFDESLVRSRNMAKAIFNNEKTINKSTPVPKCASIW